MIKLLIPFLLFLNVIFSTNLSAQYSCACGNVVVNSLSLSPSGPGCNVSASITITATTPACVNNSWTWNTTPPGSSGSVYVGFSATVPFSTVPTTLSFYMPQACSTLGSAFINFTAPTGPCTSVPLPIKLESLYQSADHIVWETESEFNCSHYIVEGSNDGIQWAEIAQASCDNISNGSNYKIKITSPIKYIRLVQYDFDGQSFISDVVKWNSNASNYYEPYHGRIITQGENLNLSEEIIDGKVDISVVDILGKSVFIGNIKSLDTSTLPFGQYIINMKFEHSTDVIRLRLLVL